MSEIPKHWRLPDPAFSERGWVACNEPLTVDGVVVAHCQVLVKAETRKQPRKEHKCRHRLEWR